MGNSSDVMDRAVIQLHSRHCQAFQESMTFSYPRSTTLDQKTYVTWQPSPILTNVYNVQLHASWENTKRFGSLKEFSRFFYCKIQGSKYVEAKPAPDMKKSQHLDQ